MQSKSLTVEKAMKLIDKMILDLNEKSLDRVRLSSKTRIAVIKKIDTLTLLNEYDFKKAVEGIFRNELLAEIVRK